MKRTLHLSSFEVRPAETVSVRLIEGPERPIKRRGEQCRNLSLAAAHWLGRFLGKVRGWCGCRSQALVVALVMVLTFSAQAAQARRPQFWADGIIVGADQEHHLLNLAVRGGRLAQLSWNQHTQEWDRAAGKSARTVDTKSLQPRRAVRVLVERHGPQFVVKRIIFISAAPPQGGELSGLG